MPEVQMQIAPGQGRFMALRVELIGARLTVEVGVLTGQSLTRTLSASNSCAALA